MASLSGYPADMPSVTDPRRTAIVAAARSQVGPGDVGAYWTSCGLPPSTEAAWCGAFCLWALHEAHVAVNVKWITGLGFCEVQHLARTKAPLPGDVAYFHKPFQHHAVVVSLVGDTLTTIDGNQPDVKERVRVNPKDVVYYSIEKFLRPVQVVPAPQPAPAKPSVVVDPKMLRGVDVSHHQNPKLVDYKRLAETHKFVIVRATYGLVADETCAAHVRGAQDAGLVVGLYHFYRPGQDTDAQFDAFGSVADALGCGAGWLPPAVDLERDKNDGEPSKSRYAPAEELVECLQARYGAAMVYTSAGFWGEISQPDWIKDELLWVAHWGATRPSTPLGMPWAIWQHKVANLAGIMPGPIDQNVARALPLLVAPDPAEFLPLAVDWQGLQADRDEWVRDH